MYGNVDAAIEFFIMLSEHVTNKDGMKMVQSLADPYVFYKLDDDRN